MNTIIFSAKIPNAQCDIKAIQAALAQFGEVQLESVHEIKFSDIHATSVFWSVTLQMESTGTVNWMGVADDPEHAEGLAIAYATEKNRDQVMRCEKPSPLPMSSLEVMALPDVDNGDFNLFVVHGGSKRPMLAQEFDAIYPHACCVAMLGTYPADTRRGPPSWALNADHARALVSSQIGFQVSPDTFRLSVRADPNDSNESFSILLHLPAQLLQNLLN